MDGWYNINSVFYFCIELQEEASENFQVSRDKVW